jgi:hydrogenase maturation protease
MNGPPDKTLLVALGNPLIGDDGFGPRVLERLQDAPASIPSAVTLVDAGTDLLNYIESFAVYSRVVLVDSILDPDGKLGAPGRVAVLDEEEFLAFSGTSQSAHQLSPLTGIRLFRVLYPEAKTRIDLLGLFVDQITTRPRHLTEDRIQEALQVIHTLVIGHG